MIYTEKKFDLMLESAWRAFESTLMLHGMSKSEVKLFTECLHNEYEHGMLSDTLRNVVEWEEMK